jgi:hypothetical protein
MGRRRTPIEAFARKCAARRTVNRMEHGHRWKRLTVSEAAENLQISEDAVRKRVQRGTLRHDKTLDGHVYVYLDVEKSDALIVKSYAMSAPKTGSVIPIGGGSAAADETKTR